MNNKQAEMMAREHDITAMDAEFAEEVAEAVTELGAALGNLAMVLGIAVGVAGMVLVALAYPAYNRVLKKEREKIAPQILNLTDELLK